MVVVMHMMVINMYLGKQPTPQVTLENSGKGSIRLCPWNMYNFYRYIGQNYRMYQNMLMDSWTLGFWSTLD
jgi:hypothetical protein